MNLCLIQRDGYIRQYSQNKNPRNPHLFPLTFMPNLNVGLGAAPARADTDAFDDYPNLYSCRMFRLLWNHMHSALHAAYDVYAIQWITKNEFGGILQAQLNNLSQNYSKYTIDGWLIALLISTHRTRITPAPLSGQINVRTRHN